MDGLSRTSGAPVTIAFNGETLLLDPIVLQDYGTIEQHLLKQPRPNILAMAEEAADQLHQRAQERIDKLHEAGDPKADEKAARIATDAQKRADAIIARAFDEARKTNKVTQQEVADWLDSPVGVAFCVWLKFSQRYPGRFTLEKVNEIIQQYSEEQIHQLIQDRDQASGTDLLGNSTGQSPTPTTATAPAAAVAVSAEPTGAASTTA